MELTERLCEESYHRVSGFLTYASGAAYFDVCRIPVPRRHPDKRPAEATTLCDVNKFSLMNL